MAKRDEPPTEDPRQTDERGVVTHVPPAVLQAGAPAHLTADELRSIESFEDALRIAAERFGAVEDYAEKYGTGFDIVDKSVFVNKSIVLLEWRFNAGDFGMFVTAAVHASDGSKGLINDGSTGIRDQLYSISFNDGKYGALMVPKGLNESTYDICLGRWNGNSRIPCGRPRPSAVEECETCGDESTERGTGRTYYLNQSRS